MPLVQKCFEGMKPLGEDVRILPYLNLKVNSQPHVFKTNKQWSTAHFQEYIKVINRTFSNTTL